MDKLYLVFLSNFMVMFYLQYSLTQIVKSAEALATLKTKQEGKCPAQGATREMDTVKDALEVERIIKNSNRVSTAIRGEPTEIEVVVQAMAKIVVQLADLISI